MYREFQDAAGRLFFCARALISIPAGVAKMDLVRYTVSSALGILVWNLFFVGAGYFFGTVWS